MGRTRNQTIDGFGKRLIWIVENLPPNVTFARYIRKVSDIPLALDAATKSGIYPRNIGGGDRSWRLALQRNAVPAVYIDWICSLFPDLKRNHLVDGSLEEFLAATIEIQHARNRWDCALEYLAKNRHVIETKAKSYYRNVDKSQSKGFLPIDFPLIVGDGWIRNSPLEIGEKTEQEWIKEAERSTPLAAPRLDGLLGDYGAYKGGHSYRRRKGINEPQHNGEIFCATAPILFQDGFRGFNYRLAHYFDYINTSEILGAELADWLLRNESGLFPKKFRLRRSPKDAFDFSWRATYPGINCLTVFKGYERGPLPRNDYFLLHKRDETQIQAQNTVHVLPAGGHQGFSKGAISEDTAIWRTVVREFFEELFDFEQLSRQQESWGDFMSLREIKTLADLFFRGQSPCAKIFLHGFGLDPITLKPEVLLTIVVDWYHAKTRFPNLALKFNWEVTSGKSNLPSRHQWVPLSKKELVRQANGGIQTIRNSFLETLPAGGACMLLAAKHFDELFA